MFVIVPFSLIDASPCLRVEKRKHSCTKGSQNHKSQDNPFQILKEAHIVQKPSIASTSSYQFCGEHMIKAQRGLLGGKVWKIVAWVQMARKWGLPVSISPSFSDYERTSLYLDCAGFYQACIRFMLTIRYLLFRSHPSFVFWRILNLDSQGDHSLVSAFHKLAWPLPAQ